MAAMSWWERVKQALSSEASDVREGIGKVGQSLDDELARKEAELNATPSERFDMILDEIEESDAQLDELTSEIDAATASPTAAATASIPLLDEADYTERLHFAAALELAAVEATQEADPMFGRFGHAAWIDDDLIEQMADAEPAAVAAAVSDHPLVEEALLEDREVLYVRAPTLHHDDIRLLVAAALATWMVENQGDAASP